MNTREVMIRDIGVGGDNPLRVQGMLKNPLSDVKKLITEAEIMVETGADLIRVAIPALEDVRIYTELSSLGIPLIADCHFSGKIAEEALKAGFSKIRLNPGNTSEEDILKAFELSTKYDAAIRLGFNSGSCGAHDAESIATLALKWDEQIQTAGYSNFIVSMKSSSVIDTVDANRFFSARSDTPLHIGVTATGPREEGIIKSSVGLGALLIDGVGNTVRVSLTSNSIEEVELGVYLRSITSGERDGMEIISCPACSRNRINVSGSLDELLSKLEPSDKKKNISVAIMGCEVNGPGEASHCDIGVCGTRNGGIIIKKGKVIKKKSAGSIIDMLLEELRKL